MFLNYHQAQKCSDPILGFVLCAKNYVTPITNLYKQIRQEAIEEGAVTVATIPRCKNKLSSASLHAWTLATKYVVEVRGPGAP